jgi:hypothetical protein
MGTSGYFPAGFAGAIPLDVGTPIIVFIWSPDF